MENIFNVLCFISCCLCVGSQAEDEKSDIFEVVRLLNDKVNRMENRFQQLKDTNQYQEEIIAKQNTMIKRLQEKVRKHDRVLLGTQERPEARHQHTAFGCISDEINLSCSDGRTIHVTSADYGMYADPCTDCCAPHPVDDCRELVEENRPEDWVSLKYQDDNVTSCSYQYVGAIIDECQADYLADYMQIFYNCQPESTDEAVGFTVFNNQECQAFDDGDIVLFQGVRTNYGNYYEPSTSTFNCPYAGIYMFSANVVSVPNKNTRLGIVKDNVDLVGVLADTADHSTAAGGSCITECQVGEVVWVKARHSGEMDGGGGAGSHFFGYLLHTY